MELGFSASFAGLLSIAFYLLALINPVSKIFVLSVLARQGEDREIKSIAFRSTIIAFLILFAFATIGNIILSLVFRLELYSLRVTGGIVLFSIGYMAISKGKFFEIDEDSKLSDISIVPLVSPMMAGPATITAVIAFSTEWGIPVATIAIAIALAANLLIMLSYKMINGILLKYSLMSPLIRMTGLIVATIAVQMILDGVGEWYHAF